jgi:hypothetical protein
MAVCRVEQWKLVSGGSRVSCGISRSEDGFSVDVFDGETCVDRFSCRTRTDAEQATRRVKLRYLDRHSSALSALGASAPA